MQSFGIHFTQFHWVVKLFIIFLCFYSYPAISQPRLDSLKTLYENEKKDSLKIVYELQFVRELHRKEHNEKKELDYAQDAIQRALKLNDTLLYSRTLNNFGLLLRYHQRYEEAIPLHVKAYELIENKNVDPIYKMIFANNAGVAGRYSQKFDLAIAYYMRALKIAEEENDLKNIAISSNGIGNALSNIPDRKDEALNYFERSLKAEKKRDNSLGIAMNYLSISDYYINKENYSRARDYLNELLRINQKRQDLYGLAITYEFFGKSFLEEGKDLERAASYFTNSLHRFEEMGDLHKQAEILLCIGEIEFKQNSFSSAREFYERSLEYAQDLNQHGLIMQNSLRLARVYELENKPLLALQYYKQGRSYEDSLKLSEQNIKIAALITEFDIEKKENQIQLLQKDKALQQTLLDNQRQQLERRRIFIVVMAIGFLLILTIFLLQYRNSQTKKKTDARILKEEKEKMKAIYERNLARAEILVTRLQMNPHFLFNSLNAITYLIQSQQNAKAMKYLVVFSRYTRMVLETSQKHVIPLREEFQLMRYYLTLEENRFDKGFNYIIEGDDAKEMETIHIPPLLLQPFIENAIWHGLLPSKHPKKILFIEVLPKENSIKIIIDDNGIGRRKKTSQNNKPHKSMGMHIIRERIDLYNKSYSGKIDYDIIDKKNKFGEPEGTRIVVSIFQDHLSGRHDNDIQE